MIGRAFKSGNSLAVRIPRELGVVEGPGEVEIERVGDMLVIRPVKKRSLAGVMEVFAQFPPDFMSEGRDFHEETEREWPES